MAISGFIRNCLAVPSELQRVRPLPRYRQYFVDVNPTRGYYPEHWSEDARLMVKQEDLFDGSPQVGGRITIEPFEVLKVMDEED